MDNLAVFQAQTSIRITEGPGAHVIPAIQTPSMSHHETISASENLPEDLSNSISDSEAYSEGITPEIPMFLEPAQQTFSGKMIFDGMVANENEMDGNVKQRMAGVGIYNGGMINRNIQSAGGNTFVRSITTPASAPSGSSASKKPQATQQMIGNFTFKGPVMNENVGDNPAQLFEGFSRFTGPVINRNTSQINDPGSDIIKMMAQMYGLPLQRGN